MEDMMNDGIETKKEVLKEIMELMTKLGYDKLKKPMAMKIEMEGVEKSDDEMESM